MRKDKVNKIRENGYEFDDTAVEFSKLTPEEAKERIQKVKDRIKEIQITEDLTKDPKLVWELRELHTALFWMKTNKNRSKFFKIIGGTHTNRRARKLSTRRVDVFEDRKKDDKSSERRKKKRQKRKAVQVSESIFSRIYRRTIGEKSTVQV